VSALVAVAAGLSFASVAASPDAASRSNRDWWPNLLDLSALRQHAPQSNPYGPGFDYAQEFARLDLQALQRDINTVLTTSQPWWPADYGNYGPFFIRMAWHSAGTYRTVDGRGGAGGGQQRFEPLNSWPDNVSLDKARRLLWPIKRKYGRQISWGDLMVLAGNVALENMGLKTIGFAGGRVDAWEPEHVDWGSETKFLGADKNRLDGQRRLKGPLGATQMGLIYVNPEGPNGKPDPLAAAHDIRQAFGRMAMDDEEIVALIAGGHTFGKAHGARKPDECLGPEPAAAGVEQQGLGWASKCGKGHSEDTVTSGLEGAWSANPIAWTTQFLDNLFAFDWVQTRSPAGAIQWVPSQKNVERLVPDAHRPDVRHAPIMFTTDLALKEDPAFRAIAQRFQKDPPLFADAFARAWFKLTHRDLGPRARYLGKAVPSQTFAWQDPLPQAAYTALDAQDIARLKQQIVASGLTVPERVRTAWASASTFRRTDMRGGANGARIRLAPARDWAANDPAELKKVLDVYQRIQAGFNASAKEGRGISLADLIVLGGAAAIEQAAKAADQPVSVPFRPGRVDASQAQTDAASYAVLEPRADAFRNFYASDARLSPAEALVDKADQLALTVPEMTVLLGGLRVLGANEGRSGHGVLTARPGQLSNDFFVNLLSMDTRWQKSEKAPGLYEGHDRAAGMPRWTATPVDLVFGANAELRAVAEAYASDDAKRQFVDDFVAAWTKVMNLDRF